LKILFSTPYIPYKKARLLEDNIDFFYYRNTLRQGIFQLRQMQSWHPLHFLAQNLPVESVVLENPTFRQFEREIISHDYDIAAFSFSIVTASRILEMARCVRNNSPKTVIIIGGYGTAIFNESLGIEAELQGTVDYICRCEGLSFLSTLLKDKYGIEVNKPIKQDLLPIKFSFFRTRFPIHLNLNFISALGCNFNCSFCSTSSQFKHKEILFSGKKLYESVKKGAEKYPRARSGVIFEEDFLENREAVMEFMHCMEKDTELINRPFYLTVFSSARNVARYTVSELVRCGIGMLYIGVESFNPQILEKERLKKRGADIVKIEELFEQLHAAGIHTLGSVIIGWDDHTHDVIKLELEKFVKLNPTLYQVMPLQAIPGTPLWQRMKQEESTRYILGAYQSLVDEGGPWPFRMFENIYTGIKTLQKFEGPEFRARVEGYKKILTSLYILSCISGLIFFGKGFRKRWRKLMGQFFLERPLYCLSGWIIGILILPVLSVYVLLGSAKHFILPAGDQPETIRIEYNGS
jgi:haloalkane dehalogenase